jgi:hypothetical protein
MEDGALSGMKMREWYQDLAELTNKIAFKFNNCRRFTCILTSYALVDVLRKLGLDNARSLLRVETGIFPDEIKLCGHVLGREGPPLGGGRRKKAWPDKWYGASRGDDRRLAARRHTGS